MPWMRLRTERELQRLQETRGVLVADHAQPADLASLRIEEDDARRAEKREALEQRLVRRAVLRHVGLQQQHAVELRAHARVAEGEGLHFLARHAPDRKSTRLNSSHQLISY